MRVSKENLDQQLVKGDQLERPCGGGKAAAEVLACLESTYSPAEHLFARAGEQEPLQVKDGAFEASWLLSHSIHPTGLLTYTVLTCPVFSSRE